MTKKITLPLFGLMLLATASALSAEQSFVDVYQTVGAMNEKPTEGLQVHDKVVVEINLSEDYSISSKGTSNRESKIDHTLSAATWLDVIKQPPPNADRSYTRQYELGKYIPNNVQMNSKSSETNEGTAGNTTTFKAIVTVDVLAVLDNGDFVIEGRSRVKLDEDQKTIKIGGIVSPKFIVFQGKEPRIQHYHISDLRVEYLLDGPTARNAHSGWLMKIFSYVWPF